MQATADELARFIEGARGHDSRAFGEIYRRTVQTVYRYVASRVDTRERAEEITQEVYLAALRGISGLRASDEAGLFAWLLQIARYKLADDLRRSYRGQATSLDGPDAEIDPPDETPGPEDHALGGAEREELRSALERLTPEQREVLVCKYVLEYDNQRTAAHLGKNANAVNQLQHRALGTLHRLLAGTERRK